MSTPVKNIEKEFLLKLLFDDKLPVYLKIKQAEYIFYPDKQTKKELIFTSNKPTDKLKIMENIELMFDYHGKAILFKVDVLQINGKTLTCSMPDFLYRDLDRMFPRVSFPDGMKVQFSFPEDRLELSFPKITEYETCDTGDLFQNIDVKNISVIMYQMASLIKRIANGYKLVFFKDAQPSSLEELIISKTGKVLYLQSTETGIPLEDPFPCKRIITKEMFRNYLESTGVSTALLENLCSGFIKTKANKGIISAFWMPIHFHEYIIGYLYIWINETGKPLLDNKSIEIMYQYTKLLAQSLKANGYFKFGKIRSETFEENILDISITGLMFTCPPSAMSSLLLKGSNLIIKIISGDHIITTTAKIERRFKNDSLWHIGCRFISLSNDEARLLFKLIYDRPLTEFDEKYLL